MTNLKQFQDYITANMKGKGRWYIEDYIRLNIQDGVFDDEDTDKMFKWLDDVYDLVLVDQKGELII